MNKKGEDIELKLVQETIDIIMDRHRENFYIFIHTNDYPCFTVVENAFKNVVTEVRRFLFIIKWVAINYLEALNLGEI